MHTFAKTVVDVSVIMPAFNRSELIVRALESLRLQTVRPAEVIVVDDASTDSTVATVHKWAAQNAEQILVKTIILEKNSGAAFARNIGIHAAKSKYIIFLDSDDEHFPETIEKLIFAIDSVPGAVVSFGDATSVTPTQKYPHDIFRQKINLSLTCSQISGINKPCFLLTDAKTTLLRASIIPTSASCFLRSAAISVGGMPTNFRTGEDWLFWLRLTEAGKFVVYLEDLALHYRHDDNLTHPRSSEATARQKAQAFVQMLDGSLAVSTDALQRKLLRTYLSSQIREWRYQLSKLGLPAYLKGLRVSKQVTGTHPLVHAVSDPKSFARAVFLSLRT